MKAIVWVNYYAKADGSPIANLGGYGLAGVWLGWIRKPYPIASSMLNESEIFTLDFTPYSAINYEAQSVFSL